MAEKKYYVVSAKPLYDDGTTDDQALSEQTVDDPRDIGQFLADTARYWIGKKDPDDESVCDALDVTITLSDELA